MIDLRKLERWRYRDARFDGDESKGGAFLIPSRSDPGARLRIIAATGKGWDHVSVSPDDIARTPTWAEMEQIKRMFFKPEECAMQLHVPIAEHVDVHPWTLHMWRPLRRRIPKPPKIFV